jgi:glycosyltransferase involved in cell wall biosynthesis
LIEEGKTGWLVEPKNSDLLAEKMSYVLNHPELAKKIGIAAAEYMAQNFSIEQMADSYNKLFCNLISGEL